MLDVKPLNFNLSLVQGLVEELHLHDVKRVSVKPYVSSKKFVEC